MFKMNQLAGIGGIELPGGAGPDEVNDGMGFIGG